MAKFPAVGFIPTILVIRNAGFVKGTEHLPQDRNKREPKAVSPTPLRDWVHRQTPGKRAAGVALFALLIACGGLAPAVNPLSSLAGSQQLLFVLLAGVILGSRLGTVSALAYLAFAAVTGLCWPAGAGHEPLSGPAAGFLWSLPLTAYL